MSKNTNNVEKLLTREIVAEGVANVSKVVTDLLVESILKSSHEDFKNVYSLFTPFELLSKAVQWGEKDFEQYLKTKKANGGTEQ